MIPTVVIVGRPNVGKSTLFNRLTRSRSAIVSDLAGLTRDRHYGRGRVGDKPFWVVDTGGLEPDRQEGVAAQMAKQTLLAIDEADVVVMLVDGRQGVTSQDISIATQLRAHAPKVRLVVNKAEGMQPASVGAEFHEIGLGEPVAISAAHGEGISDLVDLMMQDFPSASQAADNNAEVRGWPHIAIVGRPNVGKSTLANRLLGEERMVVYDEPGTTRDSISVDFERLGRRYTLIDTAGMRRASRVADGAEKFSVLKTMRAIEEANVAVLVVDATERVTDQDAHIAGFILESGRAVVVAVNKWDGLSAEQKAHARATLSRTLNFLDFAPMLFISALTGAGIKPLMAAVDESYRAAMAKLSTPKLTRALIEAVSRQQPPRAGVSRPKPRYAHQGGSNPPRIVIHGSGLQHISAMYARYLERFFRDAFQLRGTPLKIEFHQGRNPFVERRKRR